MSHTELFSKPLHRAFKVIFILVFALTCLFGALVAYSLSDNKIMSKNSYALIGEAVKKDYAPAYDDQTNEEVGTAVYDKRPDVWYDYNRLVQYENVYSIGEKIGFALMTVVIIAIIFWVISRIYFYILLGEPFFYQYTQRHNRK